MKRIFMRHESLPCAVKKRVLLMTGRSGCDNFSEDESLCGCCDFTVQSREEAYEKTLTASDFDILLISELSAGQLASAAMGIPYGAEARPIVEALQVGCPVFVAREGMCTTQLACKSEKLRHLYEEYAQRLISFGVTIAPSQSIVEYIKKECVSIDNNGEGSGLHILTGCKVITERLLADSAKANPRAKEVRICSDSIITPLAEDFIVHNGLEVLRVNERCENP